MVAHVSDLFRADSHLSPIGKVVPAVYYLIHHLIAQLQTLLEEQAAQINYFRFVINPNSFEQSVENIFYFAFLIKEGTAAWEIAENGEPLICTYSPLLSLLHWRPVDMIMGNNI